MPTLTLTDGQTAELRTLAYTETADLLRQAEDGLRDAAEAAGPLSSVLAADLTLWLRQARDGLALIDRLGIDAETCDPGDEHEQAGSPTAAPSDTRPAGRLIPEDMRQRVYVAVLELAECRCDDACRTVTLADDSAAARERLIAVRDAASLALAIDSRTETPAQAVEALDCYRGDVLSRIEDRARCERGDAQAMVAEYRHLCDEHDRTAALLADPLAAA